MKPHGHRLRLGRFSEPGRIYLITTVTRNRQPLFHDLFVGRLLTRVLANAQADANTLAYVIMPDHLHWLMQLTGDRTLSEVVHQIKSVSAHRINHHLQDSGPVWQRGFHDHAVRRDEDIRKLARYVIANPLRAGLVENISEYPLWDVCWI